MVFQHKIFQTVKTLVKSSYCANENITFKKYIIIYIYTTFEFK